MHKHAISITRTDTQKTSIFLCLNEKDKVAWADCLRHHTGDNKQDSAAPSSAFAISGHAGEDLQGNQLKLLDLMERIENFGSKIGQNFRQKCLLEMAVDLAKVKERERERERERESEGVLFLFEDMLLVARKRDEAKSGKKPLTVESKMRLDGLEIFIGEEENDPASCSNANAVSEEVTGEKEEKVNVLGGVEMEGLNSVIAEMVAKRNMITIKSEPSAASLQQPSPSSSLPSVPSASAASLALFTIRWNDVSFICHADCRAAAEFFELVRRQQSDAAKKAEGRRR